MDVESTFRVMYGIKKEQDMVALIEVAVSVASLIVPHKLKKHRSRILKLLFDEDPANSANELFSEDELGFDSDDDDDDEFLKVTSTPAKKNTSHSPEIKKSVEEFKKLGFKKSVEEIKILGFKKSVEEIKKLGFKKSVEEELSSQVVAPQKPLMMVGRQDKSMNATKKMLRRKYPKEEEEAEKKAAKKRKIDFPQPKKLCDVRSKAKPPSGHVRQRTTTFKNELKAQHAKPKSKLNSVI